MLTIITGTTNKPVAANLLRDFFNKDNALQGYLYIGYPIIGTNEGPFPVDAMWISPNKGLVVFNLIEGKTVNNYEEDQDDTANKIKAKLTSYKQLMLKRELCTNPTVITYAPALVNTPPHNTDYPIFSNTTALKEYIEGLSWDKPEYYEKLLSVIQAISSIRKGKRRRETVKPSSRGSKLKLLEESIANLDNQQSRAVIETVNGVQRIRGLAGSGKTVVLALKAAYLHAQHPEWKIAVTFNTRSLKGQFRQLINTFHIEQTNEEPDWENLSIIHAWGASGGGARDGLYFQFCMQNNVKYYDLGSARNEFKSEDPFGDACQKALSDATRVQPLYDVILVDEAQDFSPHFLKLCFNMLREPKRLVYAYDELQNLRSQSLPSPEKIFGTNEDGIPIVQFRNSKEDLPKQDIILKKCYRNSRPTLVTAHALGFGIYRQTRSPKESGLVQMFEQNHLWSEIGYEVSDGILDDGQHVVLQRTPDTSPQFLENHSTIDDLILFKRFETQELQDEWVAEQIQKNIKEDELRADDIIIINPDPLTTRQKVSPIRVRLFDKGIKTHIAGVDTTPDVFFSDNSDSIVFTGIFRAKGNEAAMVYIVNAQTCFDSPFDLAKIRNQLFTAITRSKAWVRVLGVGEQMDGLIKEFNAVKKHNFTLDFIYPTKDQREHMKIVNRDMSQAEKIKLKESTSSMNSIIKNLESGDIRPEDFSKEDIERFISFFKQKEKK